MSPCRRHFILISLLLFINSSCILAQYGINITLNKEQYMPGDTLKFTCVIPEWEGLNNMGTLHVWIENVSKTHRWKLRYPVIKGVAEGELILNDSLPEDHYAFNFQVQNMFWTVYGSFDERYKNNTIDYTIMLEDKDMFVGRVVVNKNGQFKLPGHVYPGLAKLLFTDVRKDKYIYSDLNITIQTPLDSNYAAIADTMIICSIGNSNAAVNETNYRMDIQSFGNNEEATLENVDVVAKKKSRMEEFEKGVVTGMFRNPDAYILSGLDDEFSTYITIIDYMVGRIPGFQAIRRPPTLDYSITLRNEVPSFFLDEMPVGPETIVMVPVNEIALVKVFRTSLVRSFVGGSGGVIAVYTKRGGYGAKQFKNQFAVAGYTPLVFPLAP